MKTDLDHLPERKRRDLERIVEILFAEFEDAVSRSRSLSCADWLATSRRPEMNNRMPQLAIAKKRAARMATDKTLY